MHYNLRTQGDFYKLKNDMIYYSVGALLYCPANKKTIADSVIHEKFGNKYFTIEEFSNLLATFENIGKTKANLIANSLFDIDNMK